jgi:hypothetical protein
MPFSWAIIERIGIEEQKVSDFSQFHTTEAVELAEKLGGLAGSGFERLHWS